MVVISLARKGRHKQPFYHLVARERRSKRDSAIEKIGFYDPLLPKDNPKRLSIDMEKYARWRSVGAKPTETVQSLYNRFSKSSSIASLDNSSLVSSDNSSATASN